MVQVQGPYISDISYSTEGEMDKINLSGFKALGVYCCRPIRMPLDDGNCLRCSTHKTPDKLAIYLPSKQGNWSTLE